MITPKEIYDFLNTVAPFGMQDTWDNSGLLVDCGKPVTRILTCIDAPLDIVKKAEELGCDMIVTHHPIIFNGMKSLDTATPGGYALANGISVISCHTNLDCCDYNLSDIMCERLGLKGYGGVEINREYNGQPVGYGRYADCEPITPDELAKKCKEAYGCTSIRYVKGNSPITKIACLSGAGSDFWMKAMNEGAQAYVTADVKHHEFLDAKNAGFTLIDCGHYETECWAADYLAKLISEKFPEIEIVPSMLEDYFHTV